MPLRLHLRGRIYHADGSVGGKRVRASLGTGDKARAEEACSALEARLWKRLVYGEEAVRTFAEAALSYLEGGGDRRFVRPLIHLFGKRSVASIRSGEIVAAAQKLYPEGANGTRNRQAITPARAIILHAAGLGWCPPIRVKALPERKPKRVAVDRAWIDAFVRQAEKDRLPHLAAAVLLMWQTGVRVSEAARIMPADLDLQKATVLLARTKTSEWEVRHLTTEMVVRLANLPMHPRMTVFRYASRYGIRDGMQRVCARAKIPYVPPHQAGRHSFATNALMMGAAIHEVMQAGGWKSARLVLETYAHAGHAGRRIADLFDQAERPPQADRSRAKP